MNCTDTKNYIPVRIGNPVRCIVPIEIDGQPADLSGIERDRLEIWMAESTLISAAIRIRPEDVTIIGNTVRFTVHPEQQRTPGAYRIFVRYAPVEAGAIRAFEHDIRAISFVRYSDQVTDADFDIDIENKEIRINLFFQTIGGGGVSPMPAYQTKSVKIIENGTSVITPDAEFDALSRVEVEVDVSLPIRPDPVKSILFYDYDGTLLYAYTFEEARSLTALPPLPVHELVKGVEWTHTLEEVKAANHILDVGASCRTHDGKTRVEMTLTEASGLSWPLCVIVNGTATLRIDWGDGQIEDLSPTAPITHEYVDYGDYVVTIERISGTGTYSLGRGTSSTSFVGAASTAYRDTVTKVYVGDNVASLSSYAFNGSRSLYVISIPPGVDIGTNSFNACNNLIAVINPRGATNFGGYQNAHALAVCVFSPGPARTVETNTNNGCSSLRRLVYPDGTTEIKATAASGCSLISAVHIPDGVTAIGVGAFSGCYTLPIARFPESATILGASVVNGCRQLRFADPPQGVTIIEGATYEGCRLIETITFPQSVVGFIGNPALRDCNALKRVIFESDTPPVFEKTPFTVDNSLLKIYVPDASVEAYKSVEALAAYANRIYPRSSMA